MNFNTDLALERRDIYKKANNIEDEIPGIKATERNEGEHIKITKVEITDKQGEDALGKPKGTYITIDIKDLNIMADEEIEETAISVNRELEGVISKHINKSDDILVVGLGNREVTPDSLRPQSN